MTTYNFKTDFGAAGDGVTDDSPALVTAGNTLNGTSGNTLVIPAGTYRLATNASGGGRTAQFWAAGIVQLAVQGAGSGSTIIKLNDGFVPFWGGLGIHQDGSHWAATNNIASGDRTATLITPSQNSLYSVNQYVCIAGLNIQDEYGIAFGYPPNLQFYEYKQITSIDTINGILTFSTPFKQPYLSTWPQQNTGTAFEVNSGGPAGIYSLPSSWNLTISYDGLGVQSNSGAQMYADCRSVTWSNCAFTGTGPIPTQNDSWVATNCTCDQSMEVDKLINQMTMTGCTWHDIHFQSASVDQLTMTNCTMTTDLFGSGKHSTISGCTIPGVFQPGSYAYGACYDCDISNTSVGEWRIGGFTDQRQTWDTAALMSGGTIKIFNGLNDAASITNNGSGFCRYTFDGSTGGSTGTSGLTVGITVPLSEPNGIAVTNSDTPSNTSVMHFAAVPAWIQIGQGLLGVSSGITGIADGTTVSSLTSTSINLSKPTIADVPSGSTMHFPCASISTAINGPATVTALGTNTVDVNVAFPTGFVLGYGASINWAEPARFAIPGTYAQWTTNSGRAGTFKVLGVRQDANFTYIDTDQPGGFPTAQLGTGIEIATFGVQQMRAISCTGAAPQAAQFSLTPAYNKTPYTYTQNTYNGNAKVTNFDTAIGGKLVSMTIDVQVPYTGTHNPLFFHMSQFDNDAFVVDGSVVRTGWVVDARVPGKRVILPTNTVTNPTAKGTDGNLLWPAGSYVWWPYNAAGGEDGPNNPNYQISSTANTVVDISGESSAVWPTIVVTIQTDQGIPSPAPPPVQTQSSGIQRSKWLEEYDRLRQSTHTDIKKAASVMSSLGGHARAKALSASQRSSIASTAANARWGKK